MLEPRHEFYETDERVTVSIFDKGAAPEDVSVKLSSRSLVYEHRNQKLVLDPLTGEIDPESSSFTVGKVKVEVKLHKKYAGRWIRLVGENVDLSSVIPSPASPAPSSGMKPKLRKNWEGIAEDAINAEPEATIDGDPNAGGDNAVNSFFQKIYANADDDTKKAMMKSFQESGGTTLSTSWDDVGKRAVDVKPPEGSEWRKWG